MQQKPESTSSENLWTAKQVAETLSCSLHHVLRLAVLGLIPAINLAPPGSKQNMWRFDPDSVRRWIKQREQLSRVPVDRARDRQAM